MDSKKQESNAKIDKVSQICMNIKAISEALYPDSDGQLKLIKKMIHTQESLKLALEAAQIGIWEWDFQMDAVTWSETMEALHGLKPGEFVEQYGGKFEGFQQLVHPSDRELLNAAVQRAIQEKSYYNIEFRVVWPDKSIHWLNAQGKVLYDSTEKPIRMLGIGMDITERKQAIETLKQSEEGFRVAIKNSPILVFNHDRDLKYVWLYNNPGIGALDDGIIGKTDAELLAPDEADKIMAIKRKVIEEGTGTQAEIQMTIAEKLCYFMLTAEPLFDTDGTVAGITCAAFDITDRKHFEDQLRRSERLKQEIFENSADALFLVNAQTNHIEDYNQEAVRLFGFKDKQELIGKQARSLQKNPYNEAQIKKALEELRENRFWSSELEYVSKKGREFWGNAAITFITIDNAEYLLVRIRDITERKKSEAEIERTQQEILLEKKKTEEALAIIEKDNLRKTSELEEARTLQMSMLPQHPPDVKDLDIAMYMNTCVEVGGDYYDYKIDETGTLTLILGDATGHGLKAGMVVATVKSYFQTLANECTVSELLERISVGIQNLQIRGMYMGVTVIKIKEHHLSIASSGMPPLYLYQHQHKKVERISLKGLFLGSTIPFPYQYTCLPLQPGDALLAMTDGLPELFDCNRNMLDYTCVEACFTQYAHLPAKQIIEELNIMADAWAAGKNIEDDIALMVIKATD